MTAPHLPDPARFVDAGGNLYADRPLPQSHVPHSELFAEVARLTAGLARVRADTANEIADLIEDHGADWSPVAARLIRRAFGGAP